MSKGKIETASKHSEIILRPINDAKAQVVSPADVPRESEFETGSELTEHFGFAAEMFGLRINSERVRRPLCVNDIPFAAAKDRADTGPCIRRETRSRNWISQGKCS